MEVYGQKEPKPVPIENYKIPTAIMSGDVDSLAQPADVAWMIETLGDNVIFEKQYHANHGSFCLALDMTFFSVDALNLLQKYNPTPTTVIDTFLS